MTTRYESSDDLTGQRHCKEHRSRARCSKCGRVLKSQQSRDQGICCICEAGDNLDEIWARRIQLKDVELVKFMREKLEYLKRPLDFANDPVLEILKRKVGKP